MHWISNDPPQISLNLDFSAIEIEICQNKNHIEASFHAKLEHTKDLISVVSKK